MGITRLDHYNFATSDPDATLHFYCDILGLTNAPERRPKSDREGTWILIGDHPAIHINFLSDARTGTTGAIDHIAFEASDADKFEALFQQHGIEYEKVDRPQLKLIQFFLMDPNQIRIEMNIRG